MISGIQDSVLEMKSGSTSSANKIRIYFFYFHQDNYIQITKCQVELVHTFV